MIKAVVIEDSELAKEELLHQLSSFEFIDVSGHAHDVPTAIELINISKPDLVFLDIDLPGGNAFDVLANIQCLPAVIFTTAYDKFALDAYNYNTIDYLLKPIKKERLTKAINKYRPVANHNQSNKSNTLKSGSQFFIKDGDNNWVVSINNVRYLCSVGNHTQIFFLDNRPIYNKPLNKIEERLEQQNFFRISRSHIVNIDYNTEVEPWVTEGLKIWLSCGTTLEGSRKQSLKFKQLYSM